MGKTSKSSRSNLPGKPAWVLGELVGPLNLLYIILALPQRLKPAPNSSSSLFGTGLPIQHELLALLYLIHYANRAIITPIFLNPSMSPMQWYIPLMMATFQFINSSNIGAWLVYSSQSHSSSILQQKQQQQQPSLLSPLALVSLAVFIVGLAGNISSESHLFTLRRGAAKRKAKSEGKPLHPSNISYDKVYVIPPAQGLFTYTLYPHYMLEWVEWTGYALLGYSYGLGIDTPATWFVVAEVATMLPRAVEGRRWYAEKFGKRAVGNRWM